MSPVDWLINNAGFDVPGVFDQVPLQRSLAMIQLHLLASTRLSHAVLPGMIGRGRGRIVNVASIGAFLPRPGDATYCATKAYLVTFSRAIHGELAGTGVQVQALCPGFTRTNFYQGSEYTGYHVSAAVPRALWMSPEAVVSASLAGFARDRPVCIPGIQNRILITMARVGSRRPARAETRQPAAAVALSRPTRLESTQQPAAETPRCPLRHKPQLLADPAATRPRGPMLVVASLWNTSASWVMIARLWSRVLSCGDRCGRSKGWAGRLSALGLGGN